MPIQFPVFGLIDYDCKRSRVWDKIHTLDQYDYRTMKRLLRFTIISFLLLNIAGCTRRSTISEKVHQSETEEYIVDGLKITAVMPEYPSVSNIYSVNYFHVDEEDAVNTIMSHNPDQYLELAEGPQYVYQDREYLNLRLDDFGGGLQYIKYKESTDNYDQAVIDNIKNEITRVDIPGNSASIQEEYLIPFSRIGEIEALPEKSVQTNLNQLFDALQFPPLELRACYIREKEILNENLEEYNKRLQESNPELVYAYSFTEDDEDYYMMFREMIDGIPVADQNWNQEASKLPTATNFHLTYSPVYGLTAFDVFNLFEVNEVLSEVEISGPESAIDSYKREYEKSLHFGATQLVEIELNYIVVNDHGNLMARPAWILTAEKETESNSKIYEITAIDAESMEILKSESMRR